MCGHEKEAMTIQISLPYILSLYFNQKVHLCKDIRAHAHHNQLFLSGQARLHEHGKGGKRDFALGACSGV